MPHQKQVVKWLNNNRGIIAVHQTGAGKTLTAVTASQCFLDEFPDRYVIVIAPVTLLPNFQKEMKTYGVDPKDKRYLFFSYEKFYKIKDHYNLCSNNMLIVDEAHELRTDVSTLLRKREQKQEEDEEQLGPEFVNRAHKIIDCTKHAERVLLMTATPYVNTSYDVANLLAMVKGEDPISIREWPEETKDLEELCEDVFHFYEVPKTKANRYPDIRIREEILEMDENFYSQYSQIEENLEEDFPNLEDLPRTEKFIVRLRQALLRIPDSGKVNFTIDHILETLKKKSKARIVVYSNFVESGVVNIGVLLEKYGISYGLITGSVPKKQRQKIIDDYNTGKLRVLLISKAAQRGIDLKETTSMIILDVPWNPASLEQAIGRVARYQSHSRLPEKDQKVDVYILYTIKPQRLKIADEKPSADIMMKRIIENKLEKSEEFTQMLKNVSVNFR